MPSSRLLNVLRDGLWVIPLACVLAAIALSFATLAIDRAGDFEVLPYSMTGTAAGAQTLLDDFAQSLITLGTLVLSLTLVAVQLAMGQFSPRIVRAILNDRKSQLAMGVFGGSFVFMVLTMRQVHDSPDGPGQVPGVSILVAYLLMLISVGALFLYVQHAGQSLRAGGLIGLVGDHARSQLDRRYPGVSSEIDERESGNLILSTRAGAVYDIGEDRLVGYAADAGCVLELVPAMGDFVGIGTPLFRIHGDPSRLVASKLAACVSLGVERTHTNDPAFAFSKLVDIAERSIASDDPGTAVQAIDSLHDSLRLIAPRTIPSGRHYDQSDKLRLMVKELSWDGYVRLSFDEIRLVGSNSPRVTRRLVAALEDLKGVALPDRRAAVDRQLALLGEAVSRAYDDDADARAALVPDAQGIGSGSDVLLAGSPADLANYESID
jgi:uncharacterized membrane protein